MFNAFKLRPGLTEHDIETYSVQFQLDRLVPGVEKWCAYFFINMPRLKNI